MVLVLKKVLMGLGMLIASVATAAGVVSSYVAYSNNKESSDSQFDFTTNDISDSEVVIDGTKDSAYGSSPALSFGTKSSTAVKLYLYRTKQALYMFFDVNDEHVISRAIGSNNAQDEDGVEINLDVLMNGGSAAQTDDLRIYLGVTGYSKVIRGTGGGWDSSTIIGFGGTFASSIKEGTIVNDNETDDTGYCLEYRIPYISLYEDADENTPLAFAFVQTIVDEYSGSRTRTGMSGHPTFKIPSVDIPSGYIVLNKDNVFYTRSSFANLNENLPTVIGIAVDNTGKAINGASVIAYHSSNKNKKHYAMTDSNGSFTFENVDTDSDFIVEISKNNYLNVTIIYDKDNLGLANGAEYTQKVILLRSNNTTRVINGMISAFTGEQSSGFQVSLLGYPSVKTTTDSNGSYSLNVYTGTSNILVFEKSGYEKIKVEVNELTTIPSFEMRKKASILVSPVDTSLIRNYATVALSRGSSSIYVKVLTPYEISDGECVSIGFNTGSNSAFRNNYSQGDYRLNYYGDRNAEIVLYNKESKSFVVDQNKSALVNIKKSENVVVQYDIIIPYSALDLESTQVFGAAANFFNGEYDQESDIDKNIIKDGNIDFYSTATYLRFDGKGNPYFARNNLQNKFLYYYHGVDGAIDEDIPNNADRIYATYNRTNSELELEITVDSGFGMHFNPRYLTGAEAINVVLNLDNQNLTSWALYKDGVDCYDINFRIYSDNTICYANSSNFRFQNSNQMWWSDKSHNNGTAKNFIIDAPKLDSDYYEVDAENGYTVYRLHFTYDALKSLGGAPSSIFFNQNSAISMMMYEISESSKTTVRFYTSSGDGWIYEDNVYSKQVGAFSNQSNYVALK